MVNESTVDAAKNLIRIKKEKEALDVEEKFYREIIDADDTFDFTEIDGKKLNKITVTKFSLKKGIKKEELMEKYPTCVKTSFDEKAFKEMPESGDYYEPKESLQIRITDVKD